VKHLDVEAVFQPVSRSVGCVRHIPTFVVHITALCER
jgi:hypothetical protein